MPMYLRAFSMLKNADQDTIYGEDGDDEAFGGAGTDYLNGGPGSDTMHGGVGDDLTSLQKRTQNITNGALTPSV